MGQYFRRVNTPVKVEDCLRLLVNAWQRRFGALPKDGAVRLMAAQWGIETNHGKAGACYNFGNQRPRSKASDDYTYISGDEIINGKRVAFSGDAPSDLARFRAFRTPDAGADAYVEHIARLSEVMRVLNGSCAPEDFVTALKRHKYFTASLELYTKRYLDVYRRLKDMCIPPSGPVLGYATLAPDPEGDPALRVRRQPENAAPTSAVASPSAPDAVHGRPARVVLARSVIAARAVGASDPVPRIHVSTAPSDSGAPPQWAPDALDRHPEPAVEQLTAPTASTIDAAPDTRREPASRRGAREIFKGLPAVVNTESPEKREAMIWDELARGNYPSFVEIFAPVVLTDSRGRRATFQVSVDCLAIGKEADWLRVPLSGYYAQKAADHFGCSLPTNKLVFETYKQAETRLVAHMLECQTVGKGKWQRSTFACRLHEDILQRRIPCISGQQVPEASGKLDPKLGMHRGACALSVGTHPGVLVAGHKKEVALNGGDLSQQLCIAGFFLVDGQPLQKGLGGPHGPGFNDYSHGVRLVKRQVDLDGRAVDYEEMVTNPEYAALVFAGGGPCRRPPRYPQPPSKFYMGQ
ncbi:hypothetical protein WMF38_14730 [Sorangium sp. So ce118]